MRLCNSLDAQVSEQRQLPGSAPGSVLKVRELFFGVLEVLITPQNIADLIDIVPIELSAEDHVRKDVPHAQLLCSGLPLAGRIQLNDRLAGRLKILTGKQAVVALQIEFQSARVQPVHDMGALLLRDQLVHDYFAVVFYVAAVSADHAVQADLPEVRIHFRLAAARADIDFVSVRPGFSYGIHSRGRELIFVVDQCPVNVDQ